MKKFMGFLFCCALIISTSVLAKFEGVRNQKQGGGFEGPSDVFVYVREALSLPDGAPVVLRGYIEKHVGGEKYAFKDKTGTIVVDIESDEWQGLTVTPKDYVEIYGEVDKTPTYNDIDVSYIHLMK